MSSIITSDTLVVAKPEPSQLARLVWDRPPALYTLSHGEGLECVLMGRVARW